MANPKIDNADYDLEKEAGDLTLEQRQHYRTLDSI